MAMAVAESLCVPGVKITAVCWKTSMNPVKLSTIYKQKAELIEMNPTKPNLKANRIQNNKKTIIVGDSIVKGLQQHKFAKAAKQNVQIKCFPGATVLRKTRTTQKA